MIRVSRLSSFQYLNRHFHFCHKTVSHHLKDDLLNKERKKEKKNWKCDGYKHLPDSLEYRPCYQHFSAVDQMMVSGSFVPIADFVM